MSYKALNFTIQESSIPPLERGFASILAEGTPPASWTQKRNCLHRSHNPPLHISLRSGESRTHRCPGCGYEWVLTGQPAVFGG